MNGVSTGNVHGGRCPHCHQYTWGEHHLCGVTPAIGNTVGTNNVTMSTWSLPNVTAALTGGYIPAPNFDTVAPGESVRVAS